MGNVAPAGIVVGGTPRFHGVTPQVTASEAGTKLIPHTNVPFWRMRWLEVGLCGRPLGVRFHLSKKGVPLRVEFDEGAVLESDARKGEVSRVMLSMSIDQAKLLYELLASVPGVAPNPFDMTTISKRELDLRLNRAEAVEKILGEKLVY